MEGLIYTAYHCKKCDGAWIKCGMKTESCESCEDGGVVLSESQINPIELFRLMSESPTTDELTNIILIRKKRREIGLSNELLTIVLDAIIARDRGLKKIDDLSINNFASYLDEKKRWRNDITEEAMKAYPHMSLPERDSRNISFLSFVISRPSAFPNYENTVIELVPLIQTALDLSPLHSSIKRFYDAVSDEVKDDVLRPMSRVTPCFNLLLSLLSNLRILYMTVRPDPDDAVIGTLQTIYERLTELESPREAIVKILICNAAHSIIDDCPLKIEEELIDIATKDSHASSEINYIRSVANSTSFPTRKTRSA